MNEAIPLRQPAPVMPRNSTALVQRHSKMGVASLLIALGLPILFFAVFVIMVLLQGQIQDAVLMNLTVILIGSFVGALGHLIGFILGIAGAFQKENKKVLPVLGIVLNCIPILFAGFVCILLVAFLIHPFPLGPK